MRIAFATAEVSPVAKTGGLGDVCGALPKVLQKLGHEVVVFMPYYRQAREYFEKQGISPEPLFAGRIAWGNWTAEAAFVRTTIPGSDVPLVLVSNEYFFERDELYTFLGDGLERYTFFCRAVVDACERLSFAPDIIHAHDWHTAILPLYLHSGLRTSDTFRDTRSVYTIHNLAYQGNTSADRFAALGLHSRYWSADALEHYGEINPMKAGIIFADQVTTVSPNYAREIQTPAHGAGLDGTLRSLSFKVRGILNGIDADEWDPATDPHLMAHYSAAKLDGKTKSKKALAREAGLKFRAKSPLLGVISRLVEQKGFQLLIPVLERLLAAGAQAVILGSGEQQYEQAFSRIGRDHPDSCRVWIGFDNALAHRIYAGADILLMPSMYEPCGLNQMYALRYGTIPVVRLTGGLVDTVTPFDGTNGDSANGFGFRTAASEDLYTATWIAMLNHKDAKAWKQLQQNGMGADFSWDHSARQYEAVYREAAAAR